MKSAFLKDIQILRSILNYDFLFAYIKESRGFIWKF